MFRWKSNNNNTNIGNINVKLDSNKITLQNIFKKSTDVVFYEFETKNKQHYLIVYVDDLINKEVLDRDVVGAILKDSNSQTKTTLVTPEYLKSIIHFTNIKESNSINEVVNKLVSGNAVIFTEGLDLALCLPSQYWNQRSISEPDSEVISKGPREGFVETLKTNRSMIRRKIQNPNLQFESLQFGKQTYNLY